jgi:hypothetical protein
MKILAIGSLIAATVLTAGAALPAVAAAAPVMAGLAVASGTLGLASGVIGGVQASKTAKMKEDQLKLELQGERTQAAIEAQDLQQKLTRTLATQNAIFGGSNVSLSDGTPSIIAGDTFTVAEQMQKRADLMSQTRRTVLGMEIKDNASAGRAAMTTSFLNAGASLISSGAAAAKIGSVPRLGNSATPLGPTVQANPLIRG